MIDDTMMMIRLWKIMQAKNYFATPKS